MSKESLSSKQKGYIGLGAMAVLAAATIWGSEPLYKAIDSIGKEAIYTAGTYTGKAEGFGGEVVANVTVSETSIKTVELVGAGETEGIGTNALTQLPDAIIGKQAADVDAVSGATVTSDAIIKAVNQALALARGEEVIVEETIVAEEIEELTSEAAKLLEAVEYHFTPGTYTGTAQGYGGEVTAEVTVSENSIDEIKVKANDETEEIGGNAIKKLPAKIIDSQNVEVDSISGATVTSDAIKEAIQKALEQAGGGSAAAAPENHFIAGTYTGTAQGYGGEVKAEVVLSESKIESIVLKGGDETEEIGGSALKKLQKKMIEGQTADVDAVSGATVTSDAAKEAVKAALSQAAADGAGAAAETQEAPAAATEGGLYKAGTYTGSAQGYGGEVTAEIIVAEDGTITEVKLKGGDETEEIGGSALKKLSKKMTESKSAEVDVVSGATITSDAAMEAVKQALEQAKA